MPRPVKWRKVEFLPEKTYFIPCKKGNCGHYGEIKESTLKIEELEAMRLKDIEGLSQEECAERMEVSRQTFQNIIEQARRKVTSALVEGKAISIGGGHYTQQICTFRCLECGNEYDLTFEEKKNVCKTCGSSEITCCGRKNCPKDCSKQTN